MQPTNAPQSPIVHLNGSSAASLCEGFAEAATAVRDAARTLALYSPNRRDYYVEDGAWERASQAHQARMTALATIEADLTALFYAVEDQVPDAGNQSVTTGD